MIPDMESIIPELRQQLKNNDFYQFDLLNLLQSLLKIYKKRMIITGAELTELLSRKSVILYPQKSSVIAKHLFHSEKGIADLIHKIIGHRASSRKTLFLKLWNRLDFYHRGWVKSKDLLFAFHAERHPHVNQNRGFKQRVDAEFLRSEFRRSLQIFQKVKDILVCNSRPNGIDYPLDCKNTEVLTEQEFYEFCWLLSFEFDSENDLERMFYSVFKLR